MCCSRCHRDPHFDDGCIERVVEYPDGSSLPAVREPSGADRVGTSGERCWGCGTKAGHHHHEDCHLEPCPRCGGRLLFCKCFERTFNPVAGFVPPTIDPLKPNQRVIQHRTWTHTAEYCTTCGKQEVWEDSTRLCTACGTARDCEGGNFFPLATTPSEEYCGKCGKQEVRTVPKASGKVSYHCTACGAVRDCGPGHVPEAGSKMAQVLTHLRVVDGIDMWERCSTSRRDWAHTAEYCMTCGKQEVWIGWDMLTRFCTSCSTVREYAVADNLPGFLTRTVLYCAKCGKQPVTERADAPWSTFYFCFSCGAVCESWSAHVPEAGSTLDRCLAQLRAGG